MLDELVKRARIWFEENNVKCPIYAKDWLHVGKTIPPKMGRDALKSKGFKPADIINAIYGKEVALTNEKVTIDYTLLGLCFVSKTRKYNNHYDIQYICLGCNKTYITDYGTIARMASRQDKYCYVCRGVGGAHKELIEYQHIIPEGFTLVSRTNKHINIRHNLCLHEFTRSISATKYRETESICCPRCDQNILFGRKSNGYASLIEEELTDHLLSIYSGEIKTQVLYKTFLPTNRNFRADIFLPMENIVIEITSKSNSLEKYNLRMEEKRTLVESSSFKFFKVTSKQEIEDIVRSLAKTKESV